LYPSLFIFVFFFSRSRVIGVSLVFLFWNGQLDAGVNNTRESNEMVPHPQKSQESEHTALTHEDLRK
jgi:hypothetical protein